MFYTSKSTPDNNKDKFLSLQEGIFFKDYLTSEKKYKIYQFDVNQMEKDKKNIEVLISPEKGYYSLYLFDDQQKISISVEKVQSNYSWTNITVDGHFTRGYSYENSVKIFTNDTHFRPKATYYVAVVSEYFYEQNNTVGHYALTFRREGNYITLEDGLPVSYYLPNSEKSAEFKFLKQNNNKSVLYSVKSNWGRLKVSYDFSDNYSVDKLNNTETVTEHFQILAEKIESGCKNFSICYIFVKIQTLNTWGERFSIMAKTLNRKPIVYTSGVVQNNNLFVDEIHYYTVRVGPKDTGLLSVGFLNGRVSLFVNLIPSNMMNLPHRNWTYPTLKDHDLFSNNSYYGQNIPIKSDFLSRCSPQCFLLVGIQGMDLGYGENSIKYTFTYTTNITEIWDNVPIISTISEGETRYYTFYAKEGIENIYIGVNANNAGGDCDLMVNYGQSFPTRDKSDFRSENSWAEYIDIKKDDPFFNNNRKMGGGNYTIAVFAYTNTTFSIFVTTNPHRILPVGLYHSSSCQTKKGSYCYFRYDEVYNVNNRWDSLKWVDEILASSEFLYGNGTIFADVYDLANINIFNNLPSKENSLFSSEKQNTRNFIRIEPALVKGKFNVSEDKYTLLFAVYCEIDCFFTLNVDSKYTGSTKYLSSYRENLVFVPANSNMSMVFYYYDRNNLTVQCGLISGSGNLNLYATEYYGKNTSIDNYRLDITNPLKYTFVSEKTSGQLYIDVTAGSQNMSFYVKLSNYQNWTNLVVGKSQNYVYQFYTTFLGYFFFPKDYTSIHINVHPRDKTTKAVVYANIVKVDKKKKFKELFIAPNSESSEFKADSEVNMGTASLRIDNTWKNFLEDNVVCLIAIDFTYNYQLNNSDSNSTSPSTFPFSNFTYNTSSLFTLTITSRQNKHSVTDLSPFITYYSEIRYDDTQEIHTFDLKATSSEDDILKIEISNCLGNVRWMLSENITKQGRKDEEFKEVKEYTVENVRGTKIIKTNVHSGKNHYLQLYPEPVDPDQLCKDNKSEGCVPNQVLYSIRYVSGRSVDIVSYKPEKSDSITYVNVGGPKYQLSWNKIYRYKDSDPLFIPQPANATYQIFYSNKQSDYEHMQSVCYLTSNLQRDFGYSNDNSKEIELKPRNKNENKYYIGILASVDWNDKYAYAPIEILVVERGTSMFILVLAFILIVFLGYAVFYLYKKYSATKKRLDYEMQDVRNMANISKTDEQISDVAKKRQTSKYATLTEESNVSKI